MPLTITDSSLEGVKVITPPTIFEDHRGSYIETYNESLLQEAGISLDFIQDDISVSRHNVLRGIHGDFKTWKLVSCLQGAFYLIVVNNIESSKQFRQWTSFNLSDSNHLQVLVPPGFGNGHLVMTDTAIFHYKQTTTYDRDAQFTILWNDRDFGFWWPSSNPIVSRRDGGI